MQRRCSGAQDARCSPTLCTLPVNPVALCANCSFNPVCPALGRAAAFAVNSAHLDCLRGGFTPYFTYCLAATEATGSASFSGSGSGRLYSPQFTAAFQMMLLHSSAGIAPPAPAASGPDCAKITVFASGIPIPAAKGDVLCLGKTAVGESISYQVMKWLRDWTISHVGNRRLYGCSHERLYGVTVLGSATKGGLFTCSFRSSLLYVAEEQNAWCHMLHLLHGSGGIHVPLIFPLCSKTYRS